MIMLLDKIFGLADLIFRKKISPFLVFEILFLSIPYMLALVIPMSVLVSTLYVFGNMTQEREIMALLTSGVSLLRISRSLFIFSVLLFFFLIYFNGFFVPRANHTLKKKLYIMYRTKPSLAITEGIFNEFKHISIYVKEKDEKKNILIGIKVIQKEEEGLKVINAETGRLFKDKEGGLIFILYNGTIQEIDKSKEYIRKLDFREHSIYIPSEEKGEKTFVSKGDRELSLRELWVKIKEKKEIYISKKKRNRFLFLEIQRLWVEFHKKFAIPFASIVFVIIGIPLAKRFGRAGWGSAFGLSIVVFTFHYILLVGGEELADRALISSFIAMWAGDIITLFLGIYLFFREK
jgi:lipopolysaccharide export system permease protein